QEPQRRRDAGGLVVDDPSVARHAHIEVEAILNVDDDLTPLFMEELNKRLQAGEDRADALRNTQAWFRTNPSSTLRDVRVWGAFQLSGDWRPLAGW
ncbi:MAG: CHAT domain-containing protein, partial [bacterium]